jgi:NADPH:quinone reductase-like Zn-dependent oxidoreductase
LPDGRPSKVARFFSTRNSANLPTLIGDLIHAEKHMPRIVRFYELGGPEVLNIEEQPSKQPGKGEVRIKVRAAGLNRAELLFFRGQYLEKPKLPSGVGYEAAGVVDAVGPDVDKAWIGKPVATIPASSMNDYPMLGEEVIAPVVALGEYPAKLSPSEAAAIWMQYMTAYGALISIAHLAKGDFIVIPAASSSVGLAAIQIAKAEGAISIATTRKSVKKAELLSFGADHVIATEEEDFVARVKEITGGKGAPVIFDPVAGPFLEKLAEAAALGGIIFQYGVLSMRPTLSTFGGAREGVNHSRLHVNGDYARSPEARSGEEICLRQVGRRTIPSQRLQRYFLLLRRWTLTNFWNRMRR